MATDLLLTDWQKRQAALLYHFSSFDYLKQMKTLVDELVYFVDSILDRAKQEGRDQYLVDARWGERDTSENWANNAWPFLKDLQIDLSRQLADHAIGRFRITGMNQCARRISEFSMDWATSDEKNRLEELLNNLQQHATRIDKTLNKFVASNPWSDFALACEWKIFEKIFTRIPKFILRQDIAVSFGEIPLQTGVYIAQNEPDASLQFSWKNGKYGKILLGKKFNDLGALALKQVGRHDLWIDEQRMLDFIISNRKNSVLMSDFGYKESFASPLAPSLVARNAFSKFKDDWTLVELVKDEFEELTLTNRDIETDRTRTRIVGGQICTEPGFYSTPAREQSRKYFHIGDVMPDFNSDFGLTIWQFDVNQ